MQSSLSTKPFGTMAAIFVCVLLLGSATAFTSPPVSSKAAARTGIRVPTLLHYEEDSEWYTPPPETTSSKEETPKLPWGVKPKTTVVQSKIDFDEFLAQDDRLCVVKFHAAWCKSCQKFNLHFNKLAAQYADWEKDGQVVKKNAVRIAEVEWGANLQLAKSLGVSKLPAVYFYSQGYKIDSFAAGPSRFAQVRQAVQKYVAQTPQQLQFEAKLEQGKKLMEEAARRERFQEVARARAARRAAMESRTSRAIPSSGTDTSNM